MSRLLLVVLSLSVSSCGNFVDYVPPDCQRMTCEQLGKQCGVWNDPCGEVDCGGCAAGETCRADGQCVTQCEPTTCEQLGAQCGLWDDGCGGRIDCGGCPLGEACDIGGRCTVMPSGQEDRVSGCGGFEAGGEPLLGDPEESDYCAAEVLHWIYEPAGQTLKIADARILLNCCGDHSMSMDRDGDVYVFTEMDAPEGGYGRCLCMCVYDYTITVHGIPEELITIRIDRDVTDDQDPVETVFETQLDLTLGSGSQIIDETDVGDWCGEP
jgi:hypothetical protein